jgi:DNA polymerase-3 subunit gamma/tau
MLKTLEEPPEYVKFVLATTDPQKVPATVLSRCLQFNLKQMTPAGIAGRLADILVQEEIPAEPGALRMLAQAARGSMRDGLSLLDQAIAFSAGQVTREAVQAMLGSIDTTMLVRVLDAVAAGDGPQALAVADELAERSLSFAQALRDLAGLLHRIALAQVVPQAIGSESHADGGEAGTADAADIQRLARQLGREDVQLYYQIALHGRNDLHLAPDEAAGFTMTLLRMLAFRPDDGAARGIGQEPRAAALVGTRPARTTAPVRPAPEPAAPAVRAAPAGASPAAPAVRAAPAGASPAARVDPVPATTAAPRAPATTAAPGAPATPAARASAAGAAPLVIDGDWPSLVAALPVQGLVRELAARSEWVGVVGDRIRLRVPTQSLLATGSVERLEAALSSHFGRALRLDLEVGAASQASATAAGRAEQARSDRQRLAESSIRADPVVRKLLDEFGATIDPDSIRPLD